MKYKDFILKVKKRIHYWLAHRKTIETYYMQVVASTKERTTFSYYGHLFSCRLPNSSDYGMAKQVLVDGEYKLIVDYFKTNNMEPNIIIDAGANIGVTSILLKNIYPKSKIYCIEPDDDNFRLLSENLDEYVKDQTVILYKNGLLGKSGLNLSVNSNFRDHSNCARQVEFSKDDTTLKSITIDEIIKNNNIDRIDFLKMDIEGSERFLIEQDVDVSFLDKCKCVAIEIHDEYPCRAGIYQLLKAKGYCIVTHGETTFGFNTKI